MFVINFRDGFNKYNVEVSEYRTAVSIFDTLVSDRSMVSAVVIDPEGCIVRYFSG